MLHKGRYPLPIEIDDSARTTSSPCQSPTQVLPNDETTNISSPPQISPPVQHMDEPINSMTTLQCSSHVLATDETTEHVSPLQSPSHFLETGEPSNENLPHLETTTFEEHDDQLDTSDPTQSGLATVLENISPYDMGQLCYSESILSDFQTINFIDNCCKPSTSTKLDAQYCKSKTRFISFQLKWFDNHKWLAYSDYSKGKAVGACHVFFF